jgi:hypothetical protein
MTWQMNTSAIRSTEPERCRVTSVELSSSELHKKLMMPAYAFVAYICITFLLAVIGPFDYLVLSPIRVLLYLTFIMTCFIAGYRLSFRTAFSIEYLVRPGRKVWVLIGLAVGLATVTYALLYVGSTDGLAEAIADPGATYKQALSSANAGTEVSLAGQIQTLTYGVTMCAVAAACVYRKWYPRWIIALALCYPALQIALAVKTGTFKGAGDWLIFGLTIYSLSETKTLALKNKALLILVIALFFGAHIYSQESRKMAYGAAQGFGYLHETLFRDDNIIEEIIGLSTYEQLANPIFYMTNGYAGLSAALDQDFDWTYGLGNSIALQSYATQYFDIDISPHTYMVRAEEKTGWPAKMYWSTIFPWLASDITFGGCGILFAFIGYVYPRIYCRAYYSRCPISAALLFYLNVLLIFVPCNNQLMQVRQQMIAFLGTALTYWIVARTPWSGRPLSRQAVPAFTPLAVTEQA